jgi:hypothetical protein
MPREPARADSDGKNFAPNTTATRPHQLKQRTIAADAKVVASLGEEVQHE